MYAPAVFPKGVEAVAGQELSGPYYDAAGPVVEVQIARAGYRLAAWLDLIVASVQGKEAAELEAGEL